MKKITADTIWDYIDRNLTDEEKDALEDLFNEDEELRRQFQAINRFHSVLSKNISIEATPPLHLADQIFDKIDVNKYAAQPRLSTRNSLQRTILVYCGVSIMLSLIAVLNQNHMSFLNLQAAAVQDNLLLLLLLSAVISLGAIYVIKYISFNHMLSRDDR
jgi:hypothetical protein